MLITMMLLNSLFSILFVFMNHPLSLGGILLTQTILVALILGSFSINFWYSYILFLIMIGGMLVMFIYMTSVASNEKFKMSMILLLIFICCLFSFMMVATFLDVFFSSNTNFLMNKINKSQDFFMNFSLSKLFNYPNMQFILFLMIYLLITLIAIVKIVGKNIGTLRQK